MHVSMFLVTHIAEFLGFYGCVVSKFYHETQHVDYQ